MLAPQQGKSTQYCAPGSISRFVKMRKSQGSKGQEHASVIANSSLVEEHQRPQQTTNASGTNEIDVSEEVTMNQIQVENTPDIIQNESNEHLVNREKKHCGKTILAHVHDRTMDKRPPVSFNNLGQPVRPSKEVVSDFTHLLGVLAKDPAYAPLNYVSWKSMPLKDTIWEYVQKKFILEKDAKKYVLQNVNAKWRSYKTRIKQKCYKEDESME